MNKNTRSTDNWVKTNTFQTFVFLSSGAEPLLLLRKWCRIVSNFSVNRFSMATSRASMLSIRCSRTFSSVPLVQGPWSEVKCVCNEGRVEWIDGIRVWILGSLSLADGRAAREGKSMAEAAFWSCGSRPLMINVGEPDRSSLSTPWREENVDRALDNFREPGWISSGNKTISSSYEESTEQLNLSTSRRNKIQIKSIDTSKPW